MFLWSLVLGAWCFSTLGQPANPPSQDPLMSLMLSQPKIDVGAPVTAIAWFDPPVIGPGQLQVLQAAGVVPKGKGARKRGQKKT